MAEAAEKLIEKAYAGFNARDIDAVLQLMHADVQWPNGWEGGYVYGHEAVRYYWSWQWQEINPQVTPVAITETDNGRFNVLVHQVVKDKQGALVFDGMVRHIYTVENGIIKTMVIEPA